MTENMKAKREELKAISAPLRTLVKAGAIGSINEGLATLYREQGHTTLHSYRSWQKEGYQVKKGSKALLMWAQPQPLKKPVEQMTEEEKEEQFFPVAYVFSNLQVEPKK